MLEGTWAAGAGAETGEVSARGAGAVVVLLAEAVAVVPVAVGGVWDEEVLPCGWVEKAAEARNCARLWLKK